MRVPGQVPVPAQIRVRRALPMLSWHGLAWHGLAARPHTLRLSLTDYINLPRTFTYAPYVGPVSLLQYSSITRPHHHTPLPLLYHLSSPLHSSLLQHCTPPKSPRFRPLPSHVKSSHPSTTPSPPSISVPVSPPTSRPPPADLYLTSCPARIATSPRQSARFHPHDTRSHAFL